MHEDYRVSLKKVYNRILVVVAVGSLVNARLQGDGQLHEDSVHWLKIMLRTSPCRRACAQAANHNHHQNSIMNFFLGHPVYIIFMNLNLSLHTVLTLNHG